MIVVALTGSSSKLEALAKHLPALLRRRPRQQPTHQRQEQHRLTPKQAAQLVVKYQDGASMLALAKRWCLHRTTVSKHLRRAGVAVRQRGIPPDRLDEAVRLYGNGWSCKRLAVLFECDDETVRQSLKRQGVQMRHPRDQDHRK